MDYFKMAIPYNRVNDRGDFYSKDVVIKMLLDKGLGLGNIEVNEELEILYVDIPILPTEQKFEWAQGKDDLFPMEGNE
jgi:hypothetical protein